jgi:hypothetical protein
MQVTLNGKTTDYIDINDGVFAEILRACASNCMWSLFHSIEPLYTMYMNLRYIVKNNIPGDIVECGVWSGGMMQLAALTLIRLGDRSRRLFLYDTFAGMPEPEERDVSCDGGSAHAAWKQAREQGSSWGFGGSLDDVRRLVLSTGYPEDRMVFVEGMVEDTIPATIPETIAVLRLDTDLYKSTYHEFVHLFPRLVRGGILIVDDYGYYRGAREAADRYIEENGIPLLLTRINMSVHQGVKTV